VSTWALGRFGSVLAPALQSGFDRKVAKVRKKGQRPRRSVSDGRDVSGAWRVAGPTSAR